MRDGKTCCFAGHHDPLDWVKAALAELQRPAAIFFECIDRVRETLRKIKEPRPSLLL